MSLKEDHLVWRTLYSQLLLKATECLGPGAGFHIPLNCCLVIVRLTAQSACRQELTPPPKKDKMERSCYSRSLFIIPTYTYSYFLSFLIVLIVAISTFHQVILIPVKIDTSEKKPNMLLYSKLNIKPYKY